MNLFDIELIINVPAARVAGLILVPQMLMNWRLITRSKTAQAVLAGYICLIATGAAYGFLFPWEEQGLIRSFNQLPQGRTLIFLVRSLADVSIIFFVARLLIKNDNLPFIINCFLIGSTISSLGGFFEFVTKIDLLGVIHDTIYNAQESRVRGFCYEPRGFGLITAHATLFSTILLANKKSKTNRVFLILNFLGLLLSNSTSAYVAFASGAMTLGLFYKRATRTLIKLSLICICIVGCVFFYQTELAERHYSNADERLSGKRFSDPQNFVESIAFRMEIFDGPALLFLADNPIYLVTGTGPGLMGIPATPYKPHSAAYSWLGDKGINSPPTIGLLLEVSNTRIIGLFLWCMICFTSYRAFNLLALYRPGQKESWLKARAIFMVGAGIYAVQTSPLAVIWPIIVGIGVWADHLFQSYKYGCRRHHHEGKVADGFKVHDRPLTSLGS